MSDPIQQPQNEHDWFAERIAAALAAGLHGDELKQFDVHAAACPDCAAALDTSEKLEATMTSALGHLQPALGFEERMVRGLRQSRQAWYRFVPPENPMLRRAAAAVAAALLLGGGGYVGSKLMNGEPLLTSVSLIETVSSPVRRMEAAVQSEPGVSVEPAARSNAGIGGRAEVRPAVPPQPGDELRQLAASRVQELNHLTLAPSAVSEREFQDRLATDKPMAVPVLSNGNSDPSLYRADEAAAKGLININTAPDSVLVTATAPDGTGGNYASGILQPAQADRLIAAANSDDENQNRANNSAPLAGRRGGGGGGGGFGGGGGGGRGGRGGVSGGGFGNVNLGLGAAPASPPPAESAKQLSDSSVAMATPADAAENKPPPPLTPAPPAPEAAPAPQSNPSADRKIIRNGEMKFEVESFDAAYLRVADIVRESHGYIGSTDSHRLPNGKVEGNITVRVPPENLDVLVLKLRGLGDLKDQQITAEDVTKQYTDLLSEQRAAKAMEDRLLDIIRSGKGAIKDLLEVEKELATWREKDESITGQINYYNNLVSLSTLTISLTEKDITQAAVATETETITTGLEADDVAKARDEFFKAIDAAKGRIVRAEMLEREAGQFTATIIASVPPDAAGPVTDRLKQLGRVTRYESNRQQTDNRPTDLPGVKVERKDTVINLSIFNVAAYAARTTDNLSLACDDVEAAYHSVLDFAKSADGGRVISSNLSRPRSGGADSAQGTIVFEVRESSADTTLAFLRSVGATLQMTVTENPDAANVTASKRAFGLTLNPLAQIPAQETDDITLLPANSDLRAAYQTLLDFAARPDSKARVVDKNLQQDNGVYTSAAIAMEVSRQTLDQAEAVISAAGKVENRKAVRQPDSPNVVDTKVMLHFSFVNVDAQEPRETVVRNLAAPDAAAAYAAILDAAHGAGAKIRNAVLHQEEGQPVSGELEFDVAAEKRAAIDATMDKSGVVVSEVAQHNPDNDATTTSKVRLRFNLVQLDQVTPRRVMDLEVETQTPETAAADVMATALAAGGQVIEHSSTTDANGHATAKLVLVVPLAKADGVAVAARDKGTIHHDQSNEDPHATAGSAARARIDVTFTSETSIVGDDNGLSATIKQGLSTSARGLLWSLGMLLVGACLIVPWAVAVTLCVVAVRYIWGWLLRKKKDL
jgi:hypothetical protein